MAEKRYSYFQPPNRLLLGAGPSMVDPRVYLAMAAPAIGYMDPATFEVLEDVRALSRYVFETQNRFTLAIPATGSAGMEAAISNLIEPGDKIVIFANGFFSDRMTQMAERHGAEVVRFEKPWGEVYGAEETREFLGKHKPKVAAFVHAETSTGALQDPKIICDAAKEVGALVIGDCVTSLGGVPVGVDRHGIDVAYSVTQKCVSAPPGLSPITVSPRALEAIEARKTPCQCWYLDLKLIDGYWSGHVYHHTTPINMMYALREALRMIQEETLERRFKRHQVSHQALVAGLEAMGLEMFVPAGHRLPSLNTVQVPDGVDEAAIRKALLEEFGIEILGGLGPLKGRVFRIGLMGASATRNNILLFLEAFESCLRRGGFAVKASGARAAEAVYSEQPAAAA